MAKQPTLIDLDDPDPEHDHATTRLSAASYALLLDIIDADGHPHTEVRFTVQDDGDIAVKRLTDTDGVRIPDPTAQPAPNWGNVHSLTCPVTNSRQVLWEEFCECIDGADRLVPGKDYTREKVRGDLWVAVQDYAAGGCEEDEACSCNPTPSL